MTIRFLGPLGPKLGRVQHGTAVEVVPCFQYAVTLPSVSAPEGVDLLVLGTWRVHGDARFPVGQFTDQDAALAEFLSNAALVIAIEPLDDHRTGEYLTRRLALQTLGNDPIALAAESIGVGDMAKSL